MKTSVIKLAVIALGLAAGVAVAQPTSSNWSAQGGRGWHIGGTLDVESGGLSTIKTGGGEVFDDGATDTHNSTTTLGGAIKASSATKNALAVTVNAGATSAVITGLSCGDANYAVFFEPTGALTNTSVGSKTASGFTFSCATASTTTTARALIVHY